MASRDPNRSHKPKVGQHRRTPTNELTELGQFIEAMFPTLNRWQQGEKLGVREDVFSDMVVGDRTPSQRWIQSLEWQVVLSQSDVWKRDPATHAARFKEIVSKLPLQSPYVIEPAKPDTMAEVLELAFPGYDRLEQAIALGVLETKTEHAARHFVRQLATEIDKFGHQVIANYGIRISLERQSLKHGGDTLWHKVRDKFDAIVGERVVISINGRSKPVIREWSSAVGEVFAKAQEHLHLDVKRFAGTLGEDADTLGHAMAGGWFTHKDELHQDKKPFREVDHIRTREIYLRIAEKIYQMQLPAARDGERQIEIMAALETLFPEVATAPYAKQRAGLRPAP